jgi:hypothetical protein
MGKQEILTHPSLGKLPARKVLDCIFAIAPEGNILHYHLEQVTKADLSGGKDGVMYTLTDTAPADGRERCRIIPPFVREFGTIQ